MSNKWPVKGKEEVKLVSVEEAMVGGWADSLEQVEDEVVWR
jgi:hypothetical protein